MPQRGQKQLPISKKVRTFTMIRTLPFKILAGTGILVCAITAVAQQYTFSTLAGLAGTAGSADGTGTAAYFYNPRGITVDGERNVYVADTYNSTLRKITASGVVTTLAGLAGNFGSTDGT